MHSIFLILRREAIPILVFSAAVYASTLIIGYIAKPQWILFSERREQVIDYQKLISSENGYKKVRDEISQKNTLLKERMSTLSLVPDGGELSTVLELLIARAKKCGIRFNEMQPQPEVKSQDYLLSPVVLQMNTSYENLGKYVASLEQLSHLVRIGRIALESQKDGSLSVKLLVNCLMPLKEGRNE